MNDLLQWAITTIVGILGIFIGRTWENRDHKAKKDRETLRILQGEFPENNASINLIQYHDFGGAFQRDSLKPLSNLSRLLSRSTFFFLDTKVEKAKCSLKEDMENFQNYVGTEIFVHSENSTFLSIALPEERISRKITLLQENESVDNDAIEELEKEADKNYTETRETLNQLATTLYNSYIKLVVTAHKRL